MKKIILAASIVCAGMISAQPVFADAGYIMEQREQERQRKLQLCGEFPNSSSSLLGGPENYNYYYPTMGPFAAEIESIPALLQVRDPIFKKLEKTAKRRHMMITSRDLNRKLHAHSKERFEMHGWSGTAQKSLDHNEKEISESLGYMTKKTMRESYKILSDTNVWLPKSNNGNSRISVRDSGSNSIDRMMLTHYQKNAMEILNECREFWSRMHK